MILELTLTNLITLIALVICSFWAMGKLLLSLNRKQLEERFERIERHGESCNEQQREDAKEWRRIEREIAALKAALPIDYERREDYIRGQSVLEAKLDGLANLVQGVHVRALTAKALHHHE